MRCIFCKCDSSSSKSVEHIIPESLWNTKQILPPGVVCDKCNNYFARKVEKPLLSSSSIEALRFHNAVPNKKGKIPKISGAIQGSREPIMAQRHLKGDRVLDIVLDHEQFEALLHGEVKELYLPTGSEIPEHNLVSRFLAKVAVEATAQRFMSREGGLDYLVEEEAFDKIRNHARVGVPKEWVIHSRRIYDANKTWSRNGERGQLVYEYDFLTTEMNEVYFVLGLYGIEYSINMAGPSIEGYTDWLHKNDGASPLEDK